VRLLDVREWHDLLNKAPANDGFSARVHYHGLKPFYGPETYLNRGDRKSSLFKFYLRSGNFGLNARIHHGPPNAVTTFLKSCKFCPANVPEIEEHFLMNCSAYTQSRRVMWLNLEATHLAQANFVNAWLTISLSPPSTQFEFLLGRTELHRHPEVAHIVDSFVRPFLLNAAYKRKTLVSHL
jgi:hypothetical protein